MKNKKEIRFYIAISSIALVYSALVISFLSFIKLDTTVFIAIIGLAGAIIGGAISGIITLTGVKLTIEYNKKERFLEEYKRKRYMLNKYIDTIEKEFTEIPISKDIEEILRLYELQTNLLEDIIDDIKKEFLDSKAIDFSLKIYKSMNGIKRTCPESFTKQEILNKQIEYVNRILSTLREMKEELNEEYNKFID